MKKQKAIERWPCQLILLEGSYFTFCELPMQVWSTETESGGVDGSEIGNKVSRIPKILLLFWNPKIFPLNRIAEGDEYLDR
jgi:hypothetical protein